MRVLASLLALAAVVSAQTWSVERSRLATILFGISFADQDYGILAGAQNGRGAIILRTLNGGESYHSMPFEGQPLPAISTYMSAHIHSATSASVAGLCAWCFEKTGVEYTTDGEAFQLADDPSPVWPPVVAYQGGSLVKGLRTAHFAYVGDFGDNSAISHSPDGGVTWHRVPLTYTGAWPRYISTPSSSTWYVTAGWWPGSEKRSNDVRALSAKLSMRMRENNTEFVALNYDALQTKESSARKLLQSEGVYRTAVLKTTDGGATWQTVFERLSNDFYLNNIDCLDVSTCYTVGDGDRGVGLRTTDGGRTWQEVISIPGSDVTMMDVRFVSRSEGFAASGRMRQDGFSGSIYHTTNAGSSWTEQSIVGGVVPISLAMYRNRDGSTGGHGTALTRDGQSSTIVYRR